MTLLRQKHFMLEPLKLTTIILKNLKKINEHRLYLHIGDLFFL